MEHQPSSGSGSHLRRSGDARPTSLHAGGPSKTRVAMWMFAVCALVVATPIVLPGSGDTDSAGLIAVAALLLLLAGVLGLFARRLSDSRYPVLTIAGCGLIAAAVYFSAEGGSSSHEEILFLPVALYAAYFYDRRTIGVHIAAIAVAYGAALTLADPASAEGANWLVLVATLGAAAALLSRMKERVDAMAERLTDVARSDLLTGLVNRSGFMERFEYELEQARRSGRPLSVLVGDLDRFNELNERYGHPVGDDVLIKVGSTLDTTRRRIDTAARIGGEEFALLAPFTDTKGAVAVAERIRRELSELFGTPHDGKPGRRGALPVTISFGIVSYPAHGQTVETLMHAAKRALADAKKGGRNRAVVYRQAIVPEYAGPPVAPVPD